MYICPLCNGLMNAEKHCPKCGLRMDVSDRLENYEDSYAPYLSYNLTDLNDGDPPDICSHRLVCNNCKHEEIIRVKCISK